MTPAAKIITGSVLGAGVIAAYGYVRRLMNMKDQLVVTPKASIAKMNLDGLTIRVDAVMKNPTKGSFSLKFPFIKLLYKDVVVGSSQAVNEEVKIPAHGEARIEKIMITIPVENIFSVTAGILKAVKDSQKITLKIEVITEVNLGWIRRPYKDSQEVVLAT
jgi:hypothetical protein